MDPPQITDNSTLSQRAETAQNDKFPESNVSGRRPEKFVWGDSLMILGCLGALRVALWVVWK